MSTKPSCPIAIKIYRKRSALQNGCEKRSKRDERPTSHFDFHCLSTELKELRVQNVKIGSGNGEFHASVDQKTDHLMIWKIFFKLDELEECRNRSWLWERILADCDSTKGSA